MTLSRPPKLTHAQTILYEIDMFNFAASILREGYDQQNWLNLEGFLLHFRNLIDFFGKEPVRDDLSISRPDKIWGDSATVPSAEKLDSHFQRGNILRNKYEGVADSVSRYLHHCTEQRVVSKEWRAKTMFDELSPLLQEFESLLPGNHRPWPTSQAIGEIIVGGESFGTATVSHYPAPANSPAVRTASPGK